MGSVDFILNVCRSLLDVLHIGLYLLFVAVAIAGAIKKYDISIYMKYIYIPVSNFLVEYSFNTSIVRFSKKHDRRINNVLDEVIRLASAHR
jgi:hypothetical protein